MSREFLKSRLWGLLLLTLALPAFAATINVPGDHATIQAAVNAASPGDTIQVAAGTYNEQVTITKAITLRGANAGVHPAVGTHPTETVGVRGAETILDKAGSAIRPDAADITLDGLKFTGASGRIINGSKSCDNLRIANCIFDIPDNANNNAPVQLDQAGTSHLGTVFEYNIFRHRQSHALFLGGSGSAYDGLQIRYNLFNGEGNALFWAAGPLVNGVIQGNEFDGTVDGNPGSGGTINLGQGGNIQILDNWWHDCFYTGFQVGIINGAVKRNKFEGTVEYPGYWSSAFELWGGQYGTAVSTNVLIEDNEIHYNDVPGATVPGHGVRLRVPDGAGIDGSTIHLRNNKILNGGVRNDAEPVWHQGNQATKVDAILNWWGTASFSTLSALIDANVKYVPYLDGPPPAGQPAGPIKNVTQNTFHGTIQDAVTNANSGDEIQVQPGTYAGNATINKNVKLVSTGGCAVTVLDGVSGQGSLGTLVITGGTSGVQIGDSGQGFTIRGIDNGAPGIENAAVYFQGAHSGAVVKDNEIEARGDAGLMSEYGLNCSGFTITDNTFSGMTFVGPTPADNGFGNQYTTPNVPRQLVVMGSGSSGAGGSTGLTFTNNQITGTAGGSNGGGEQGNGLVTLDVDNATITGNTFAGTTTRWAAALRVRRPGLTLTGNTFTSTGMGLATEHLFLQNNSVTDALVAANTVDKGAYVAGKGDLSVSVGGGVGRAAAADTLTVLPGVYAEEVLVDKALTIEGAQAGVDPRAGGRTEGAVTESIMDGGGTRAHGFFVKGASDGSRVSNVTIDGFELRNATYANLRLDYVDDATFKNLMVHNCTTNEGIKTKASCANLLFQQVISHDNEGDGIELGDYGTHTGHVIEDSWFYDNEDRGIYLVDTTNVTIRRCEIYGNDSTVGNWHQGGIIAYEAFSTHVEDCDVHDNAGCGIHIYKENYGGGAGATSITGGSVHHNQQSPSYAPGDGIRVYLSHNVAMSGLDSHDNAHHGVTIGTIGNWSDQGPGETTGNVSLTASSVYSNGSKGVLVEGQGTSNVSVTGNSIAGNTNEQLHNTTTPAILVNASANWWGAADLASVQAAAAGSNVDYTPWLHVGTDNDGDEGFRGDLAYLHVDDCPQTGATGRINEALALVTAPGTIEIEAGTFAENLTLNKRVNLLGAGSGSTILSGPSGYGLELLTAAGGGVGDPLTISGLTIEQADTAVRVNNDLSHVSLSDVDLTKTGGISGYGLNFNSGMITDLALDEVTVTGFGTGLKFGTAAQFDGVAVTNSAFGGNNFGFYWDVTAGKTTADNLVVEDTTFIGNATKAVNAERLNNARFQRCTFTNSGSRALEINLKKSLAYQNLQVLDSTFTNCGSAVSIKGRNDSSYAADPGKLTGLTISGCSFTGGTGAIDLGNQLAGVTLTNNTITGPTGAGLVIYGGPVSGAWSITGNAVTGTPFAMAVGSGLNVTSATWNVHHNRLIGSTQSLRHEGSGKLTVENNWFGSNDPIAAGKLLGNLDADPWLKLTNSAAPASVPADGSSSLVATASLNVNSAAADTSGAGTVPATPVAWSTLTDGTFSGQELETVGGLANATLTSGSASGTEVAKATVDGVTVGAGEFTGGGGGPSLPDAGNSTVAINTAMPANVNATVDLLVTLKDGSNAAIENSPVNLRSLTVHAVAVDRTASSNTTGMVGTTGLEIVSLGADSNASGEFTVQVKAPTYADTYEVTVDVGGVVLNPTVEVEIVATVNSPLFGAGTRLMGIPVQVGDTKPLTVYSGASQVMRYDSATNRYVVANAGNEGDALFQVNPGRGMFVTFSSAQSLSLQGAVTTSPYEVALLEQGYTDLANPFNAVLNWQPSQIDVYRYGTYLGKLSTVGASTVNPTIQVYDGRRFRAKSTGYNLAAYEGFRIYCGGPGYSLKIPNSSVPTRQAPSQPTLGNWTIDLSASLGDEVTGVQVGVTPEATRAASLPFSPAPNQNALEMAVVSGVTRSISDLVAGGPDQSWELAVVSRAAGDVTLSWGSLLRDVPRGLVVELQDLQTGKVTLLNTRAGYRYAGQPGERRFALRTRAGNIDRATITSLTVQPTRGAGASLSLTLSGPGEVSLTVRGLGGKVVKQVSSQSAGAGVVQVVWDGTDSNGRKVPRGSYVVEAVATSANGATSRAVRTVTID